MRLGLPDCQRALRGSSIGHIVERPHQRLVVLRHGLVVVSARRAVLALDAPAGKDRQADRRARLRDVRPLGREVAEPERLQADQPHQVDVGIEARARHGDPLCSSFGPEPCRCDIGAAADEIEREIGRQSGRCKRVGRGQGNRRAALRPGAEQRGDAVAGEGDGLVGRGQIAACQRHTGIGLALLTACIEPTGHAAADERRHFFALLHRGQLHLALGGKPRKVGISGGYRGGEHQPRGARLDRCGLTLRSCGPQRSAVLAEEIQFVIQVEAGASGVIQPLGHELRGKAVVVALLGLVGLRIGTERREQRAPGTFCVGCCLARAGIGGGQRGRACQRFLDQRGKLRIAVVLPPAIAGPLTRGGSCHSAQRGRIAQGRAWAEIGYRRAAAQRGAHGQQDCGPRRDRGTFWGYCGTHR